MTKDGGEQPMWRLIGSSRTPQHMAITTKTHSINPLQVLGTNHLLNCGQQKADEMCSLF
jgi:hypothetical protein